MIPTHDTLRIPRLVSLVLGWCSKLQPTDLNSLAKLMSAFYEHYTQKGDFLHSNVS